MSKSKTQQMILYLCAALAMCLSIYLHLRDKIRDLQFSDLVEAWPIFFLFGAIPIMLVAASIINWRLLLAAKIALYASMLGCCYYVFTACLLFVWISVFVFVYPVYVFQFTIPSLLLFFIIRNSRKIIKSVETLKIS
jgi:hypothetical protein